MKGKRLHVFALLATTAAAAAGATFPVSALAGSQNLTATQAYIRANYALVSAGRREVGSSEAAVKGLLHSVSAECPGAAAGSLQGESSDRLGDELQGAMTIAALRPVARAVGAFVHAVADLRWSSSTLTHRVTAYAGKLRTLSSLSAPQVCADVRAWTATGFATLPASTTGFDLAFDGVDVALGEVPAELLAPYERPQEHAMLHSTAQVEAQLAEAENRAVQLWEHTLATIGVVP
jgi:hypothetical protein